MRIAPFLLERFFAEHEFSARFLLCSSDSESVRLGELLALEAGSRERLESLWLGYTESQGGPALRDAVAATYERTSASEILVHAGAEEAIFNFAHSVLEPGDHVIVHWPCYQSLAEAPRSGGCLVTHWEADPEDGWELDVERLPTLLRANTRAIVLNSPHNPTGHQISRAKLDRIIEIARRAGLWLFVDEVYRGLEHDPKDRLPAASDLYEKAISLGVLSKAFGLPGLRIGWIATRDPDAFQRMASFKDYLTICNSAPSEFLAALALNHRDTLLERNRDLARRNLAKLAAFFERHADRFEWVAPKVGCIAFPRVRAGDADVLARRALEQGGVLIAPGFRFLYDPRHFRVGFGRGNFIEALVRFEHTLP